MNTSTIKILMFAPWFPPHRSSEAHTTGNLVLAMLKKGWQVDVVSEPRYELFDKMELSSYWTKLSPHCYPVPIRKTQQSAFHSYIDKIKALLTMKYPITGTSWARYAYKKALKLHEQHNYDVVLSRSPATYGHIPALQFSKKTKIPWVPNWNDVEPASRSPYPYSLGRDNKADFWTELFVQNALNVASHHTLPSKRLLDYMSYWAPDLISNSTVIPHIALENDLDTDKIEKGEKFTICHAGIFDGSRDPTPLLLAMQMLIQKYPNRSDKIELHLLGNNFNSTFDYPIPDYVRNIIKVLPWCDYEQSLSIMKRSTVLMVVEADMKEGIMLPAKLADYVHCRRPILSLSPPIGTMHDLIVDHGGGVVADCTSADDIMMALGKLYSSWESGRLDVDYALHGIDAVIGEHAVMSIYAGIFSGLNVLK